MMAAILSLFLQAGINIATLEELAADLPVSDIEQPLLAQDRFSNNLSIAEYRGAGDLIANTVSVMTESGFGSGVVLSPTAVDQLLPGLGEEVKSSSSFIITNFHVIQSGEQPIVLFAPIGAINLENCETSVAAILSTAAEKDLALLSVPMKPNHVSGADVDLSSTIRVGDDVEAVGHPSGQFWTYTRGYVSQIRDDFTWQYNDSFELNADVIQTQTPISTGNSGGPLFNRAGKIVGINSFSNEGSQNINFAVSTSEFTALRANLRQAVARRNYRNKFSWSEIDSTMSATHRKSDQGISGELYFKQYIPRNRGTSLMAFYESMGSMPLIMYRKIFDGQDLFFFFSTEHSNPNAVFNVSARPKGADEERFSGWDFDGDFIIDYVN